MLIIYSTLQINLGSILFFFVLQSLQNLNFDICVEAKSQAEINVIMKFQAEFVQMIDNLQEGIVVIQNEAIVFSNTIFEDISHNKNLLIEMLDQEIYKVFRSNDEEPDTSDKNVIQQKSSIRNKSNLKVGKIFSLRQLYRIDPNDLEDTIFEIDNEKPDHEAYKYVMLKINGIIQE